MRTSQDESGVIVSWFVRVALFFVVIGVVGFDIGSIVVNNFTLGTAAQDVAVDVSISVSSMPGRPVLPDNRIYDMAVAVVEDEEDGIEGVRVVRKGTEIDEEGNVTIRLRRRAETLVTELIGPLKKYTVATGTGQAGTN